METSNAAPAVEPLKFDKWCLLEIMGHQKYAGRVTEQTIAGGSLLRVDIPATGSRSPVTKFFNVGSVYSITPIAEDVARALAEQLEVEPVSVWDLPAEMRAKLQARPAITAPSRSAYREDDDADDDLDPFDGDDNPEQLLSGPF